VQFDVIAELTITADPVKANMGKDTVGMMGDLLESLGLWPLTHQLSWTVAQYDRLISEIRSELRNNELKLYVPV
jgi:hypothetical protein